MQRFTIKKKYIFSTRNTSDTKCVSFFCTKPFFTDTNQVSYSLILILPRVSTHPIGFIRLTPLPHPVFLILWLFNSQVPQDCPSIPSTWWVPRLPTLMSDLARNLGFLQPPSQVLIICHNGSRTQGNTFAYQFIIKDFYKGYK